MVPGMIHTDFEDFVTPILDKLDENLAPGTQRKAMRKGAVWLTTEIKSNIGASKGLENQKKYKKLKIKYRYHGRKTRVMNKRNIALAKKLRAVNRRSAVIVGDDEGISFTNKTKVTKATKPLVDRGNFKRSWGVLRARADRVDVGPRDGHNGALAIYHGPGKKEHSASVVGISISTISKRKIPNRTDTRWGDRTSGEFMKVFMRMVDAGVFDR